MATEEVKVFGSWGSPFSRRVEMALKLKGIPYEYIEEDLQNKSPELIKYNPIHKKVPVLVHNGKPIAESLVIVEYIDETWKPNPILPLDPYDRATARFWAKFIEDKGTPLWMQCWTSGDKREKALEESHQTLETLEDLLKDRSFFGGDNLGFADIAANLIAHWVAILEEAAGVEAIITKEKYPNLCRWIVKYKKCPLSWKAYHQGKGFLTISRLGLKILGLPTVSAVVIKGRYLKR